MVERKLKIDLSGLWVNPNGFFILRFQDLSEEKQTQLATRIKLTAPQYSIRNMQRGPTIEDLKIVLREINPIIFSEDTYNENRSLNSYRRFNFNAATYIAGYRYKDLCQAIYKTICIKKGPSQNDYKHIAHLSCPDWLKVDEYVNRHLSTNNTVIQTAQRLRITEDIGMDEIRQARERAINDGAERIPSEMYLPEFPEEELEEYQHNIRPTIERANHIRNIIDDPIDAEIERNLFGDPISRRMVTPAEQRHIMHALGIRAGRQTITRLINERTNQQNGIRLVHMSMDEAQSTPDETIIRGTTTVENHIFDDYPESDDFDNNDNNDNDDDN